MGCDPNPCQNGGECSGAGSCSCLDGWLGENCETSDPCNPDPCQNGGTCSEGSCTCTDEYTGNQCETEVEYNWAVEVLDKSSEYNSNSWGAIQVIGEPNVYPRYGDIQGAWAHRSASSGPGEFIEVRVENPLVVSGINVYET